jgi:hypothetical protein
MHMTAPVKYIALAERQVRAVVHAARHIECCWPARFLVWAGTISG